MLRPSWSRTSLRRCARGLSLVELLVGIAVGLFVVAGAAMLTATQLGENRKLVLDAQIQQDLRAAADIISRDVRRAGYYRTSESAVWVPGSAIVIDQPDAVTVAASEIEYRYRRRPGDEGPYKFRLNNNRVQSWFDTAGGWQDLTDVRAVRITAFQITPTEIAEPAARMPCPRLCADGTTDCWPTVRVRDYQIDIAGESALDSNVKRSIRTIVRMRNDSLLRAFGNQACPA
jgi:type IV pilus assembly protein PilW